MINESIWKSFTNCHIAGIVPVSSNKKYFNFPWDDCLMPIGDDYTLVENAVVNCAAAGCKTIWVVCNDSTIPLLRQRMGEYVIDPKCPTVIKNIAGHRPRTRYVPIFYVPCNPRDVNKRDSLGYAVLHGAKKASMVSASLSKWIVPQKYFVTSPYCAYHYSQFLDIRTNFRKEDEFFFFTNNKDQTIKDDLHLPFIASPKMLNECRRDVHAKSTSIWAKGDWKDHRDKLPAKEQYSARNFSLAQVFSSLPDENFSKIRLEWYWEIKDWQGYTEFMASHNYLKRPSDNVLPHRTFLHPLSVDLDH